MIISKKRSLVKSVTSLVMATAATFLCIYFLTGEIVTATAGTILANSINFVMYYLHERVWIRIRWGVKE